jgi:hypothetical protein
MDERVVQDHVGGLQLAQRAKGDEIGIARPGAEQRHEADGPITIRCVALCRAAFYHRQRA